jgi:hypothetical protein
MESHPVLWKVQLWLGDHLIEEHVAPPALAEQYANVIRLRISNVPGRRLRCEPVSDPAPDPAANEIRTTTVPDGASAARVMEPDGPSV